MGLMQGKVVNRTFCVMDSFALPVQGTETRVNAQEEASGYMITHMEGSKTVSNISHMFLITTLRARFCFRSIAWRTSSAVSPSISFLVSSLPADPLTGFLQGITVRSYSVKILDASWLTSCAAHPGYGCWLSGIDVSTQMTNQRWQDPFLAVVVRHQLLSDCRIALIGSFPASRTPSGRPQPDHLRWQGRHRCIPYLP